MVFRNRQEAGRLLAQKLIDCQKQNNLVVLAIPRGGVVIGKQLADFLNCPLEVVVTKKIPAPNNPELAIGAVGTIGVPVINEGLIKELGVSREYLDHQIAEIKELVKVKENLFRPNKTSLEIKDQTVVLTDDGVATGATMKLAIEIIRQQNPQRIIVAIPVIAKDSLEKIETLADEVRYLEAPEMFFAIGQFYNEFNQITDEEVKRLLE